ncbi:MAG: hypothetical protein IPL23_27105 [Saprospiraceae bacterium]|nr:hypothetical protein [Saprospiraceae bacterium]
MKILNPAFIILLFCFLSAQHTFAQTERNLWLVNGSGNVKFVNNKEVQRSTLSSGTWKEFYIDSDFKVGNFIVDDFSLGLSFFRHTGLVKPLEVISIIMPLWFLEAPIYVIISLLLRKNAYFLSMETINLDGNS